MNINFRYSVLILFSLLISCEKQELDKNKSEWKKVILEQKMLYPEMQIQDLYKIVYQSTFGSGHMGTDEKIILSDVQRELNMIDEDSTIDLIESISPTDNYIRINLKRFKYERGNPDLLAEAFAKSASESSADTIIFVTQWKIISELIDSEDILFDKEQFNHFSNLMKENHYPVVHHSETYVKKYSPAYRVLSKKYWDEIAPNVLQ